MEEKKNSLIFIGEKNKLLPSIKNSNWSKNLNKKIDYTNEIY
jgi:hypothetical protein